MTLTEPLSALHFGEIQTFDDVVDNERYVLDQRAYVVNLTRTIAFRAEADALSQAQHGGHLMVMMGGVAHVDGVEFQRFGQMSRLGRYPFHWHLMGDVDGQYIRRSAIHDSYNRCVVVHSTNRARVTDNVCYNHFGHGYFLEEGNEEQNVLSGNIGISATRECAQRRATGSATIPCLDVRIPHPNNDVHGNVAVGLKERSRMAMLASWSVAGGLRAAE